MADSPTCLPVPENPTLEQMLATCQKCRAKCCTYMAIQIDTPTTLADFENIRWYCAHQAVWVFKEGTDWYVVFDTPCEKLQSDYTCGVYPTRPQICRDYKWGECDYFLRGEFDLTLSTLEEVDAYIRRRFPQHFRKRPKARASGASSR